MNNLLRKAYKLIIDSDYRFLKLADLGVYNAMSDEEYIKRKFKAEMGYSLPLDKPETYNEKLQWLKLYDRDSSYTCMVDKYSVKQYVADKIGKQYIIPSYGVWDKFSEIEFDKLPNSFVLKCTHDSGGLVICKDKNKLNYSLAKKKICACLKRNFFYQGREWPYKNVKPRILAEMYLDDETGNGLNDYKFFCFNGVPKIMFVATERQKDHSEVKFDFFDMDFKHLDIHDGHQLSQNVIEKPYCFEEMKSLASKLSTGVPQLRVDFYEYNNRVYFGELTFFQRSGFCPITPKEWDYKMGSWIELPLKKE